MFEIYFHQTCGTGGASQGFFDPANLPADVREVCEKGGRTGTWFDGKPLLWTAVWRNVWEIPAAVLNEIPTGHIELDGIDQNVTTNIF